ncbi:MAG: hypothetical protein ABL887_09325 [Nitrosomonas sp.]
MQNKKRTKKRMHSAAKQKQRVARLHVIPKNIETEVLPDGRKIFQMHLASVNYEIGYTNDKGKFKCDFRSPRLLNNWLDELELDWHYCFVDTNIVSDLISNHSDRPIEVPVTGWYIFQLKNFETIKNQYHTDLMWNVDYINSRIGLWCHLGNERCTEKDGWQIAIDELKNIGAKKVKIIVDAYQNEHNELSKELPEGWSFYYASSDRSATWFNHIFRRLDKAITTLVQEGSNKYEKVDVEKYLMGNVEHLIKRDGAHHRSK